MSLPVLEQSKSTVLALYSRTLPSPSHTRRGWKPVTHTYDPSWKVKAGRSKMQGHLWHRSKLDATMNHMRPSLRREGRRKRGRERGRKGGREGRREGREGREGRREGGKERGEGRERGKEGREGRREEGWVGQA